MSTTILTHTIIEIFLKIINRLVIMTNSCQKCIELSAFYGAGPKMSGFDAEGDLNSGGDQGAGDEADAAERRKMRKRTAGGATPG